jgi:hypothetical protein
MRLPPLYFIILICFWAFPFGSGYTLQCFFAAGATQKTISAAIPNAGKPIKVEFQMRSLQVRAPQNGLEKSRFCEIVGG